MKKVFALLLLAIVSFSSYSFIFKKKTTIYGIYKIEKNWGMVKDGLYANKFETTNKEYQVFLNSIKSKATADVFEQYSVKAENWNSLDIVNDPMVKHYYQHPSFADYPLVNVSHHGAKAYCEWLTEIYNHRPNRKYKKVKFRLPSEEEWVTAAQSGHNAPFPWGGYYTRNGKGWKLANFRSIPETAIKRDAKTGFVEIDESIFSNHVGRLNDESAFPAPVYSYFPNDFGLYNMSGNVAEMLNEKGNTKGGSWASTGYYIRIDTEDEYAGVTKPSPQIGFRYFVEVIEE